MFTTNSRVASILFSVFLRFPSEARIIGEKQVTGGFAETTVKKLNAARLDWPSGFTEDAKAIGRGTTAPVSNFRYRGHFPATDQRSFLSHLLELTLGRDDEEDVIILLWNHAVRHGARNVDVIVLFISQWAKICFDRARAAMHELQLVGVGVTEIEWHWTRAARHRKLDVVQ